MPHRDSIEEAFGHHDIGDIQAHVGGAAADSAAAIGADAYATGDRIAFSRAPDLHLAAHEAAHVVQQRGGAQLDDGVGRPGDAHERHADAVADRVVRGESAEELLDHYAGSGSAQAVQLRGEGRVDAKADALREEMGISVTTVPEVGGSQKAYVGGQIQFGLHFARPPTTRSVRARSWGLTTPAGQWSQVPTGPTTTLPITKPGTHRFSVDLVIDDVEVQLDHEFEAMEPAKRTDTLIAEQQALSLDEFGSQLALQQAVLRPPGPSEQGAGAALHINTSAANPARHVERDVSLLAYWIEDRAPERELEGRTRYQWYARPFRWDGMPRTLGGHPRVKLDDTGDAYDLGTGPVATLPASHHGTFVVLCRAHEDGKPPREARYLQTILTADEAREADKIAEHGQRVDDLGGRIEGDTVPVVAAHVAVQTGAETTLRLYLGRAKSDPSKWRLLDLTPGLDAEHHELEYEGDSPEEVLESFDEDNRYPKGAISLRMEANPLGVATMSRRFETDGQTLLGAASSRAGVASLLLGLGAVVAAPFTGGGSLLVAALMIGSATAAAAAGALSLADHLKTEEVSETAIALDVLTIATSFLNAGLAIRALRGGPAILVATRGARFLLWTSFTLEGVSAILVGVEGANQIIDIVESNETPEQKSRLLVAVVANLILTGAMMAVSYGDLKNTRGRLQGKLGKPAETLADADSLTLALLDDDTLEALHGAAAKDLSRLADVVRDDPSSLTRIGGRADLLPALKLSRGNKALDLELAHVHLRLQRAGIGDAEINRLLQSLRQGGIDAARIPRFADETLKRLANPEILDELEAVASLQQAGRVKGLADWIEFGAAKTKPDLGRVAHELREARRRVLEKPGSIVLLGADARAPLRPGTAERMKSSDMTLETADGRVIASIEVTELRDPLYANADFAPGVRHGIDKIKARLADGAPIPGEHHVTIIVELRRRKTKRNETKELDRGGERTLRTRDGRLISEGNLYEGMANHMSQIGGNALLDLVTLVEKASGEVLTELARIGATWIVRR